MKALTLNSKMLALGMALCFGLLSSGEVFAQTANPTPHFNFKLEAFDALTHGAVTAATKQIVFGVTAENNTDVSYSLTLSPQLELVVNIPQDGNGLGDVSAPVSSSAKTLTLNAFSDQMFYIASAPVNNVDVVTLKNASTTHSLQGSLMFNITYTPAGGTKVTLNNLLATEVIYKPSNADVIPLIYNIVNKSGTTTAPVH